MNTITVGQLRQNPTGMLEAVQAGTTFTVTRHGQEIGRIVPPLRLPNLISPRKTGPARTADLDLIHPSGGVSLDELLEEVRGEW